MKPLAYLQGKQVRQAFGMSPELRNHDSAAASLDDRYQCTQGIHKDEPPRCVVGKQTGHVDALADMSTTDDLMLLNCAKRGSTSQKSAALADTGIQLG